MHVTPTVRDLLTLDGTDLGSSPWLTVGQDKVDQFADLTGDHQWIHVDLERAATGPYGATIAHGMLTLSYVPIFIDQVLTVEGAGFGLNYGFDRIRFTSPVPAGSRVRGHVEVMRTEELEAGVRVTFAVRVEIEGSERPALLAEQVIMWLE